MRQRDTGREFKRSRPFSFECMAFSMSRTSSILRIVIVTLWTSVILVCLGTCLLYPQEFTGEKIAALVGEFNTSIWLVYIAMSAFRGLTLLPSTPLVIAGTLLFPTQPFAVLAISIVGIFMSSSMIYFFSDFLGFTEFFERRKPELTFRIKEKLERPTGIIFVGLWAFFPLVPTDLVCYVAGTTRTNYFKFISAILIGELILCAFYVFSGSYLMNIGR